jgi:hypothetical protein
MNASEWNATELLFDVERTVHREAISGRPEYLPSWWED